MATSAQKRLVEKARKIHDQRRQNLIEQIGTFKPLNLPELVKREGHSARVYDTGHLDEHGAEGTIVVVGDGGGVRVGYVWDEVAGIKRTVSIERMDPVRADAAAESGQ